MMDRELIAMDKVFGWVFGVLGVAALVGVCLGAWWHVGTLVMCVVMVWMLVAEIKKERKGDSGQAQ